MCVCVCVCWTVCFVIYLSRLNFQSADKSRDLSVEEIESKYEQYYKAPIKI